MHAIISFSTLHFLPWIAHSIVSKKTNISSLDKDFFYIHSILLFFQNSFVLETEKDSSSPDENHQPNSTTSISKLRLVRLICVTSFLYRVRIPITGYPPPETRNQWRSRSHARITSSSFFFSRTVTRQRHNYIIRCTLLPWCRHRGPVAHATPCARTHGNR